MPPKSKKPCNAPRCPNLTREKYCPEHSHQEADRRAERDATYDRHKRDPMITEFYKSAGWRALRHAALSRDLHLCQPCMREGKVTPAVIVHHILEVDTPEGWERRFYLDGVTSVCRPCHNKIHKTGCQK